MAVSKRIRFEILKRDKFRCTYCGLPASETGEGLTIDHVIPVALGGTNAPVNLVAACKDCNAGKTSASLEDGSVPVAADLDTQLLAIEARRAAIRGELETLESVAWNFERNWGKWHFGGDSTKTIPLPHDWRQTVFEFHRQGAPQELFDYAIPIAMAKRDVYGDFPEFRYFVGIVRNKLADHGLDYGLTPHTAKLYTKYDVEHFENGAYSEGWAAAEDELAVVLPFRVLAKHIDGTLPMETFA